MLVLSLCALLFLPDASVHAQERDSQGREFFLCFPPNYHQTGGQNQPLDSLYICITAEKETRGRIEYRDRSGRDYIRTFEFTPPITRHVESFAYLDFELQGDNLDGLLKNPESQNETTAAQVFRVVITSTPEVSVFGLNHAGASSDGFMALPADALDGYYTLPSLPSDVRVIENRLAASSTPSQFAVVALDDNSEILIQPGAPLPKADEGPLRITLQRGEAYLVQSRMSPNETQNDLTGTIVLSDGPLAVFTGHQRTQMPAGGSQNSATQDHILQQVAPVSTWGKEVRVAPLANAADDDGIGSDLIQILATNPETTIRINGSERAVLQAGETLEELLDQALFIVADEPIYVTHYRHSSSLVGSATAKLGDPFALPLTPSEQWQNEYHFSTAQAYTNLESPDRRSFDLQYLNVVIRSQDVQGLTLNGESLGADQFRQAEFGDFVYANIKLDDGAHVLRADQSFGAHVYGFGKAESYAYPAGAALLPINLDCNADAGAAITVCQGDTVTLSAISSGFGNQTTYRWSPDEFLITSPFARQLRFRAVETAWYKVIVRDERDCRAEDSVLVTVTPRPRINAGEDQILCVGETTQLGFEELEEPISSIRWSPADKLNDPTSPAPTAFPEVSTGFVVEVETLSGCVVYDTVVVNVRPRPIVDAGEDVAICRTSSTELQAKGGVDYEWRPTVGLNNPNIYNPIARPTQTQKYFVRVTDEFGCVNEDSVTVIVEDCAPCEEISGVINDYASVITIDRASRRVRVVDASSFAPGDLAMIVQMQGADINLDQSENYGRINSIATAGAHELVRIADISLNFLSTEGPINNSYDDAGKVQVVRVPEYDHVTVTDRLHPEPWNGNTGGILAMVANCLIVEDTISVDSCGFRGGEYEVQSGCLFEPNTTDWVSDQLCRFSYRGEGVAAYGDGRFIYGRGAPANAGGGGNNHNAGGGGGANGGPGGSGGNGFRNFANWSDAGGVGGRSLAEYAENDTTGRLFMGGGGGAGHVNHTNGSGGARGGGIIYIRCGTLRSTPNSLITARGVNALDDDAALNPDGCGGGGAGGTIMLHADQLLENVTLDVRGGNGGTRIRDLSTTSGPGGGGAGGIVLLSGDLDESEFEVLTSLGGGVAGELGMGSGNTYGAGDGGTGARITNVKVNDALSNIVFDACDGCYPVRKAIVGGCGEVEFNIADANFEVRSVVLSEESANVVMTIEELNTLRVAVRVELDDPSRSGSYTITGRNVNNKESIFRGIILPRPPMPELLFRNDSLFIAEDILPFADSIQWYSEERGTLAQQTAGRLALVDSGVYWVQIWNEEGCSASSERYNFNVVSSIRNNSQQSSITLAAYPNPAVNMLTISCRTNSAEKMRLQINDLYGRMLYQQELPAFRFQHEVDIDLHKLALAPAAYVVSVSAAVMYASTVFIKQP